MKKILTILALLFIIFSQSFAIQFPADSSIRIKRDTIVKPERDSVIAPPEGWQNQKIADKNNGSTNSSLLGSNNAPTLVFPANYASINGTSVGLYWNKNNSLGTCDYLVRVVDLTTLTPLYNYTNAGDNSSFGVQNLIAGRNYAISIKAVNKANANDFAESTVYNISVPSSNVTTISLTSINATTFCGNNRNITIYYTRTGNYNSNSYNISNSSYYAYGNTFVELSDKNGSFANPILIGGVSLNSNSGSFGVSLPSNLVFGTNYKIRLFAYTPVALSGESSTMTIGTIGNDLDIINRFDASVRYNSLSLCNGSSALIKTQLPDTTGMTFQWKKDGVNVALGGNSSKYTVKTGGNYTISITQGTCPTITSGQAYIYNLTGNTTTYLNRSGDAIQCGGGSAILTMPYWSDNQTYQWQRNGQSISGANQRTYTAYQTGNYSVRVVDGSCSITATSDALTFGSSISLTPSLGASTICSTGGQTFASVSPSYSPNLSNNYQWKRNGLNISGATSNSYTITQGGVYNVQVTQGGCTATSQGMEVKTSTTLDSIKIIQDLSVSCSPTEASLRPSSTGLSNVIYNWVKNGVTLGLNNYYYAYTDGSYTLTIAQGSCVTTSKPSIVTLNTNTFTPTLYINGNSSSTVRDTVYACTDASQSLYIYNYPSGNFQWFKDGVMINGATSSNYFVSQRGSYYVRITTSSCVLNSRPIFVENTFPKFSLNVTPQSTNVCVNNIVKLDYFNKGFYPYNCTTWKKDGATLTTCGSSPFSVLESGIYTATVQQGNCSAESEPINIKINEPITASISGNTTMASGGTAKVYVTFTGSAPWTFTLSDGNTITTSNNPYIYNVTPTNSTTYTLTSVMGSCGVGTVSGSGIVTIGTCITPTVITTQPLSQTKCTGSAVTFSTIATGGGTLTYQWKKDGQNISGATNSSYVISNLKTADIGNYSVEVTGTCGTVFSNNALLKPVNNVPAFASATNPVYVGSTLRLSAGSYVGNVTYAWQGPNGYTSNLQNPVIASATVSNGGVYTLSVDNGQGCVGQAVASTNVLVANITLSNLSNTTFCAGGAGTLNFSPVIAGHNYAVQISDSNGSFGASPTIIGTSQNSSITFNTPSGYSSGTTSTYVLRVVDLDDIMNVSAPSAVIYFNALYASVETIVGKNYASVCTGSSLKMYARLNFPDNNDVVYEWKKDGNIIGGVTNATYISNQAGSYVVKATKSSCGVSTSNGFSFYTTSNPQSFYNNPDQYQCAGNTVPLKADYASESAVYVWRKDGVIISNPTPASILNVNQSGSYNLTTTDANCTQGGSSSTRIFTFGNIIPTSINSGGKDTLISCVNYSTYLYHNTGSQNSVDYTYQWFKDGNALLNENRYYTYAYTEGLYALKITQGICNSFSQGVFARKNGMTSKVIVAPYGSQNCSGNNVYLYLDGLTCASYQWQKDGVDIVLSSSTNAYFYATQSGDYRLKINDNGVVSFSNVISVVVSSNPTFSIRSNSASNVVTCLPYAYYYLNNAPSGTNFYEWYKNNVVISGANYSSYEMFSAGTYKLKVTNGICSGFSQDVIVASGSQISKPQLISNGGKIVCGNTYINLQTNYVPYVNYEWKLNGQTISLSPYTSSLTILQSGIYTVAASQNGCSATSDPLVINIGDKQQSIKTFNWNDASTWSCGSVPVVTEDILINKGHTVTIPNNYTGFMKDLQLNGSLNYGTNALLKSRTN
jgi:hypothetical protein